MTPTVSQNRGLSAACPQDNKRKVLVGMKGLCDDEKDDFVRRRIFRVLLTPRRRLLILLFLYFYIFWGVVTYSSSLNIHFFTQFLVFISLFSAFTSNGGTFLLFCLPASRANPKFPSPFCTYKHTL